MKAYNNKSIRFSRIKGQLNWGVNLTRYWGRSEVFRYLGVDKVANETKEVELTHGLGDGANFLGALKNVWKDRIIIWKGKNRCVDIIIVPTMLYGCEA